MHHAHLNGFHPRKAIMNPEAVSLLLDLMHAADEEGPSEKRVKKSVGILDPFMGSGTTAIECLRRGWRVVGTDISPTAISIARCHSWLAKPEELVVLKEAITAVVSLLSSQNVSVEDTSATSAVLRIVMVEQREQQRQQQQQQQQQQQDVVTLKSAVSVVDMDMVENTLWFLLDFEENRLDLKGMPDAKCASWSLSKRYQRTSQRYLEKLEKFRVAVPAATPLPRFEVWDAKVPLCQVEEELFDGIVTSPPYPGVYNYVQDENQNDSAFVRLSGSGSGSDSGSGSGSSTTTTTGDRHEDEIGSRAQLLEQVDDDFQARWQRDTVAWMKATTVTLRMGARMAMLIGNNGDIDVLDSVRAAAPMCGGNEYDLVLLASASVREEDKAKRPWGRQSRLYRTEHTILLEKQPRRGMKSNTT